MSEAGGAPSSFLGYYLGAIVRPRRTFDALMRDPRRLRHGATALLIAVALYTLVYVFLTAGGGAPSTFEPWLAIPKQDYYAVNRFLLAPSMIGAWLLASAVAQLAARRGRFEDTAAAFGFAIGISVLASLAHDLPDSFLGAIGVIDQRAYELALNSPTVWRAILWALYGLSSVLFLVLFPKAVGAVHRLRPLPAVLIGWLSFAVYQTTFLVFNR